MERSRFFSEINGNFGFGCMRLPMKDGQVDYPHFEKMSDAFIEAGFNYFDTAHGYINGLSETAIRDCVSKRYDRDRFLLTDKLTDPYFNKEEDIRPFFMKQLELCGVEYFDFYLMHAQDHNNYPKYQRCNAYQVASQLKKEGLIKHLGISFHDKAEVLDMILRDHPEVEIVQIQLNYVDYEDASVQSRLVYEVCEKYGKPVIVMEPVKGGSLVNLPAEANRVLDDLTGGADYGENGTYHTQGGRNAAYAIRFAASHKNIAMVLSGMSSIEQMDDNITAMRDFKPLDEKEMVAVQQVCGIFKNLNLIPCTSCRYCIEENECPKHIVIPEVFAAMNAHEAFHDWNSGMYYNIVTSREGHSKASECIKCGKCEKVCPQHLPIRELLVNVAKTLEASA